MFAQFYQNRVLKNPKTILILLIIAILSFGYYSKDFLILTYTPNEGMVSDNSINNLLSLKYKIQSLNWVHSVITLLDKLNLDHHRSIKFLKTHLV